MFVKNLLVRLFVKLVDKNIKVIFHKGELQCDTEEEKIFVGYDNGELANRTFKEYVLSLEKNCVYNDFIMGLLHEVGHIVTYNEEDEQDRLERYSQIDLLNQLGAIDNEQTNFLYYEIPMEKKATQWGIDWAMTHQNLMKIFDKIIVEN